MAGTPRGRPEQRDRRGAGRTGRAAPRTLAAAEPKAHGARALLGACSTGGVALTAARLDDRDARTVAAARGRPQRGHRGDRRAAVLVPAGDAAWPEVALTLGGGATTGTPTPGRTPSPPPDDLDAACDLLLRGACTTTPTSAPPCTCSSRSAHGQHLMACPGDARALIYLGRAADGVPEAGVFGRSGLARDPAGTAHPHRVPAAPPGASGPTGSAIAFVCRVSPAAAASSLAIRRSGRPAPAAARLGNPGVPAVRPRQRPRRRAGFVRGLGHDAPMARPTLEATMAAGFTLVIDCSDPDRLSRFWEAALGTCPRRPPDGAASWDEYWRDFGLSEEDLTLARTASPTLTPSSRGGSSTRARPQGAPRTGSTSTSTPAAGAVVPPSRSAGSG